MADARLWEDGTGRRSWQPVSGHLALSRLGWLTSSCSSHRCTACAEPWQAHRLDDVDTIRAGLLDIIDHGRSTQGARR